MSMKDLKGICKSLSIPMSGKKCYIVERILQYNSVNVKKGYTYGETADANKRGNLRANFEQIFKPQLEKINKCRLIFNGSLDLLDPDQHEMDLDNN